MEFSKPSFVRVQKLPPYCDPESDFLVGFTLLFGTCVPTSLAFVSTLLGCLSILSWLFAQLPQIYKNHALRSTSGLSIFFLAEWFLGDFSNLLGSIFTRQAGWQVTVAAYYCTVDIVLLGQWIWYEFLGHGQPLKKVRTSRFNDPDVESITDTASISETSSITSSDSGDRAITIPKHPAHSSSPGQFFRNYNLSRSPSVIDSSSTQNTPPQHRYMNRVARPGSPAPSPKTVLYISLIFAVLCRANPIEPPSSASSISSAETATEAAGRLLSWLSTLLYLGSRLPQIIKNHRRRSTAGLSPTLFAAAFFGNLFYSSSLLFNPNAWHSYPPGPGTGKGSRGWVGPEGSDRGEWIGRAIPFFLGAAGVLFMDAIVGLQFWYFAHSHGPDNKSDVKEVVVVAVPGTPDSTRSSSTSESSPSPPIRSSSSSEPITAGTLANAPDPKSAAPTLSQQDAAGPSSAPSQPRSLDSSASRPIKRKRRIRWRRVSGWMRGWVPSPPSSSPADRSSPQSQSQQHQHQPEEGEERPLLSREEDVESSGGSDRASRSHGAGYGGV